MRLRKIAAICVDVNAVVKQRKEVIFESDDVTEVIDKAKNYWSMRKEYD